MAWDLSCNRILSENLYPLNANKVLEDNDLKVWENMNVAIESDISNTAIHNLSISMFQAVFSRTDNQSRRLLFSYWAVFADLRLTDMSDQCDTTIDSINIERINLDITNELYAWFAIG
jgi:hypothetical protein